MPRSTIVLDIDDCIVPCFEPMAHYHNQMYGTQLTIDHFTTYYFWEVFGCELQEGRRRCVEFFHSPEAVALELLPGAAEVIPLLAREYRLVSVTGRAIESSEPTGRLLERCLPGCIEDVIHTSSMFPNTNLFGKGEAYRWVGACLTIDDCHHYEPKSRAAGVEFLLFGDYPWNREATHLNRVLHWHEVAERLLGVKL